MLNRSEFSSPMVSPNNSYEKIITEDSVKAMRSLSIVRRPKIALFSH